MLRRDELIPREHFKRGDRIRAYIFEVARTTGPANFSIPNAPRNLWPNFFAQEVPEIYDGIITIKAVVAIQAVGPRSW